MDGLEALSDQFTRGVAILGAYFGCMWGGDKVLSEEGRKDLYEGMTQATASPTRPLTIMDGYFGPQVSLGRLFVNTFIFSIASMAALLAVYITSITGFRASLVADAYARKLFMTQVFFNGLPVVFAVNWFAFGAYGSDLWQGSKGRRNARATLAIDIAIRLGLFILVTGVIYIAFSQKAGAFGGDTKAALKAIGPTLRLAATFGDLTGVYLYAAALGSFPLFISAFVEQAQASPGLARLTRAVLFYLPFKNQPVRAAAFVLGLFGTLVAAVASLLAILVSG